MALIQYLLLVLYDWRCSRAKVYRSWHCDYRPNHPLI